MCDDFTARAEDKAAAASGLTRRDFAAASAAAALSACAGTGSGQSATRVLRERTVTITMADGIADAFFVHPAKGRHPAVIVWPDIAGLRESFRVMARRLAADGHAVLVVNQYYRSAPAPVLDSFAQWRTPEGQAKLRPMIAAITPEGTMRDATGFVTFLDRERAVDTRRRIGSEGYCMGGPFAVRTGAAVPGRIGAAAAFHPASLVTDKPDSPHLLIGKSQASFLVALGRNDDARAPTDKDVLRRVGQETGRPMEVEVYAADHGWCVPDSPVHDRAEADRAYGRLLALYAKL